MKRPGWQLLLLCLAGTAVGLLIGEALCRVCVRSDFQSFFGHDNRDWQWKGDKDWFGEKYFRISPTLGYEMLPDRKVMPGSDIGTNSLGMLDAERSKEKPAGVFRIICIGDSTTANSVYTRKLEKMLNSGKGSLRYEVWNCGVPGYGLPQYLTALEEKWLACKPDLVVFAVCNNDFNVTPVLTRDNPNRFLAYYPNCEIVPSINVGLFRVSALYRTVYSVLFVTAGYWDRNSVVGSIASNVVRLKRRLDAERVQSVALVLGVLTPFAEYSRVEKMCYWDFTGIFRAAGIEIIDTTPVFEANAPESLRLSPDDSLHFDEAGSRLVADTLYGWLMKRKLPEM